MLGKYEVVPVPREDMGCERRERPTPRTTATCLYSTTTLEKEKKESTVEWTATTWRKERFQAVQNCPKPSSHPVSFVSEVINESSTKPINECRLRNCGSAPSERGFEWVKWFSPATLLPQQLRHRQVSLTGDQKTLKEKAEDISYQDDEHNKVESSWKPSCSLGWLGVKNTKTNTFLSSCCLPQLHSRKNVLFQTDAGWQELKTVFYIFVGFYRHHLHQSWNVWK